MKGRRCVSEVDLGHARSMGNHRPTNKKVGGDADRVMIGVVGEDADHGTRNDQ
jgi:hypothetical protein